VTIRRQPGDFEVREKVAPGFLASLGDGPHVVYEVTKMSMTTPEAAAALARTLGIRPGLVEHAGLKDKHARTTQLMSVPVAALTSEPLPAIDQPRWSARCLGRGPEPVNAAAVEGNAFRIVVRGLTRREVREMGRRASLQRLSAKTDGPAALLFINYFGEQRFGSARHGRGWIARALIAGQFEEALRLAVGTPARKDTGVRRAFTRLAAQHWGDWDALARDWPRCPEREAIEEMARTRDARRAFAALPYFQQEIAVDAFQSHLWNLAASRLIHDVVPREHRLSSADKSMLFAVVRAIPPDLRAMICPLPSPTLATDTLWGRTVIAVLAGHGLTPADLRIPGLRRPVFGAGERPLLARAENFDMGRAEPDDLDPSGRRLMVTLGFDLPRGAYATVLLRSLGQ
jgi:tRNA pseudouridine13 synthase